MGEVLDASGLQRKKRKRPREITVVGGSGFEEDTCCCRQCGKRFGSPKALYGHMRCHPERWWRGINPPSSSNDRAVRKRAEHSGHVAAADDDREVADCLLMLSDGSVVTGESKISMVSSGCRFLDLSTPSTGEQLSYTACPSSGLNLELSLS